MKRVASICLAVGLLLADDPRGIRPRGSSADYPARQTVSGVTAAAAVLPPDQVKKLFATDLNAGGYIVVEVAIYPEAGKEVTIASGDFQLRMVSDGSTVRPASARAIAASLQRKNTPDPKVRNRGDVNIYPSATIGYESGTDPYSGRRRSGVYTAAGVGVGVGPDPGLSSPRPASTDMDRSTMEQELADKALPEGRITPDVAGYLYFPKPSGKPSKTAVELTWYGNDRVVRLKIPAPK
jgi:hypothetical protein